MEFQAEYKFEAAYKLGAHNFTADYFSRWEKREDTIDNSEGDEDLILIAKKELEGLKPFFNYFWKNLSCMLPTGDESAVEREQSCLKTFFLGNDGCLDKHHWAQKFLSTLVESGDTKDISLSHWSLVLRVYLAICN